jgi:hypothetical protein
MKKIEETNLLLNQRLEDNDKRKRSKMEFKRVEIKKNETLNSKKSDLNIEELTKLEGRINELFDKLKQCKEFFINQYP